MGNESEYIDFWLTTSHDSHFNSSYSASNTPNPKLFESKKKLKVHYFIGGSAIMLSITGYALTILPLFIPLFLCLATRRHAPFFRLSCHEYVIVFYYYV